MPMPAVSSAAHPIAAVLQAGAVAAYALAKIVLVLFACHRALTLWRLWRSRPSGATQDAIGPAVDFPTVTVQLPLYNERRVAGRLIDAVAALEYPAGRLEIQVLDDSTDDTTGCVDAAVARHRARGVDIHVLRRAQRTGHKAGALAAGLARARGEWNAVFDADFLPAPDFLTRVARHFADPRVGMVQARWGHLNRDRSLVTAAQAVMLDSQFLLEHEARMRRGLFFNFNGSAGVWRRATIEDAGGWSSDTLTEDLDLSYRAQLRGWRFVFDGAVEAPAELPADLEALKSQQRRWARGSIQTARKLLPAIAASRLPLRVKLEAFVHLTSNVCYPLLLILALMLLPVMLVARPAPAPLDWGLPIGVGLLGIVPVVLFLAAGQLAAGRRALAVPAGVAAALILCTGLSVNNARAVLGGLGPRLGDWERTPKTGEGTRGEPLAPYPAARGLAGRTELLLALYFAGLAAVAWAVGQWQAMPFIALLIAGFGVVGVGSLRASLGARHGAAAEAGSGSAL